MIPRFLEKLFGPSWKSTTSAILSAAGSFVLFADYAGMVKWPSAVLALAMFANVGGLAALGIMSKDYNVSGTRNR